MNDFHAFDNAVMARVTRLIRTVAIIPLASLLVAPVALADDLTPRQACNVDKANIAAQAMLVDGFTTMTKADKEANLDIWVARWSNGDWGDFSDMLRDMNAMCAEFGIVVTPKGWKASQ